MDLVNSVIIFFISSNLTQMVNFPTRIPYCDSHSPALLNFFLLVLVVVLKWLFLHWDILIMLLSQFLLTFHHNHNGMLIIIAYDYSRADWDDLCDHLRHAPWEDIFKLSTSAATSEFCEQVQVGIDMYIPHRKHHVKSHSSPWFSAACSAAIVHRNHFFCLDQKDKSSECKVKFRQASNHQKRILEAANFAYANKTKESITSQKLGSLYFW